MKDLATHLTDLFDRLFELEVHMLSYFKIDGSEEEPLPLHKNLFKLCKQTHQPYSEMMYRPYWEYEGDIKYLNKEIEEQNKKQEEQNKEMEASKAKQNIKAPNYKSMLNKFKP